MHCETELSIFALEHPFTVLNNSKHTFNFSLQKKQEIKY